RYITRAIAEELNPEIQVIVWGIMDSVERRRKDKMDYLQVFNITANDKGIRIVNKQEQPQFEEEYLIRNDGIANENITIWIIDEPNIQTMMFPRDY
ncbi:hypothetical protein EKO25_26100, partial [Bacillus sp. SAJ1]